MPPNQQPYSFNQSHPQADQFAPNEPPKKKHAKLLTGGIITLVLLVLAAGGAYWAIRSQSEAAYVQSVREVNDLVAERMIVEEKFNNGLYDAVNASGDDYTESSSIVALKHSLNESVQPYFDDCKDFRTKYYDSSEVPRANDLRFLSSDKKAILTKIRQQLVEYERSTCKETKAQMGLHNFSIDLMAAYSDLVSFSFNEQDGADMTQLEGVAVFKAPYKTLYEKEVRDVFGDDAVVAMSMYSEYFSKFHEYMNAGDFEENTPEYQELMAMSETLADSDVVDGFEKYQKKLLDTNYQQSVDKYKTMKLASDKSSKITNFSEPMYAASVLFTSTAKFAQIKSVTPNASDTKNLIQQLKEAEQLDAGLAISPDNITYTRSGMDGATFRITDPINKRSFEMKL